MNRVTPHRVETMNTGKINGIKTPGAPQQGAREPAGSGVTLRVSERAIVERIVKDWGEVDEGLLHRIYGLAMYSEEIFYSDIQVDRMRVKEVVLRFFYTPSMTEEEVKFIVPASWSRETIEKFLNEVVWRLATLYR